MPRFGIEIECLVPGVVNGFPHWELTSRVASGLASAIEAAGIGCRFEGYNHRLPDGWKIVTDASLSPPAGFIGLEIVSPPLEQEQLGQVEQVCTVLAAMGVRVNKSCGLHVHVDARGAMSIPAMKRLAWLYHDYEASIDGLMPPSRRANAYCHPLRNNLNREELSRAVDVQGIQRAIKNGDRYVKLNFAAYFRHGTIEFRQHSGTVDPVKIVKWVLFCNGLVELAKKTADMLPRAAAAPAPDPVAAARLRLRRARQLRIILDAVARPQGATSVEVQSLLGRSTPPALGGDLARIGVPFERRGRRGGHAVYHLRLSAPPEPVVEPSVEDGTLPTLLTKMELGVEDVEFWNARAMLLAGTGDVVPSPASDLG